MNHKTTVYLPDERKQAITREAKRRHVSEAEVIRQAIAESVARPKPRAGFLSFEPFADEVDTHLVGFGDR